MAIEPGTRLGPYEVAAQIGEGGMGEVYRARDPKLDRDVALKVLPEAFTSDPERLARFKREAKLLAALNHPNIAAIYGFEDSGATHALVLELVEGPTLSELLSQHQSRSSRLRGSGSGLRRSGTSSGPASDTSSRTSSDTESGPTPGASSPEPSPTRSRGLPLDEALPIAKQIAEALEAAHEQGIIHRDLKPANIKVREDGTVKVLDFGLAKALGVEGASAVEDSPTITAMATQAGVIMGTAPYMSPEQAKGKPIDKRTDIWAFGCVLFEILTGKPAFGGETVAEALAAVLSGTPDWDAIPETTPFLITRLIRRCLDRDRRERIPDAGTARIEIGDALTTPVGESTAVPLAPQLQLWQRAVPATIAAVALALGGLMVGSFMFSNRTPAEAPSIVRMPIPLGTDESFSSSNIQVVAISPDGRHIVYSANNSLWLRPVDQLQATPIAGTDERARVPFFSPDGQWIGYYRGGVQGRQDGQLKKVSINGGAPVIVAEAEDPWGATWGADDTILFARGPDGIWQVPGTGGIPEQLITLEDGWRAHGPQMLPGNEWVLFTLAREYSSWSRAQIVMQSVVTGERQVLIEVGRDGRYVPTGHLVYALSGTIVAVPFDVGARTVLGGPVPLVEGISFDDRAGTGVAHFSVANSGTLVYIPGNAEQLDEEQVELVWVDREGQLEPIRAEPRPYDWARLSPDGTRVAVHTRGDDNVDVWVYDLARGTLTRLTFDEAPDAHPLWTPDGSRVVFGSERNGGGLFSRAADGTGEVELLLASQGDPWAYGWAADGRLLFDQNPEGIGVLAVDGERTTEFVFDTEFLVFGPALSPDGRWMAYGSNESGRQQIYVRPFPNVDDGRWLVSVDRGYYPVWAPDGRELYFLTQTRGGDLMVARVETEPTFTAEAPERLFASPDLRGGEGRKYDVAPDGDRFIFLKREAEQVTEEHDSLVYVQNWTEELKARVPRP